MCTAPGHAKLLVYWGPWRAAVTLGAGDDSLTLRVAIAKVEVLADFHAIKKKVQKSAQNKDKFPYTTVHHLQK